MSNRSQSQESSNDREVPVERARTAGEMQVERALAAYRSRYANGHDASVHAIEAAMCELVDEMKHKHVGPVDVVLAIKHHLHEYPASVAIHADIMRRCIEHYYE